MAGESPPRHRHDGSSPLPMGIDASPTPSRWDGEHTVWPHDPRTGWSYCVFVPSWVVLPEAKDADGKYINPTVFFRVQVGIQSPDGISTLRPTLRRFSDFLKLAAALKRVFPKKKIPATPPKNSLMRMNSSHSLLQERRHSVEEWIGRLLADIDISRSVPLASFLELEAAVSSAMITTSEGQPQASAALIAGLPPTNNTHLHQASSLRSGLSWTGGGSPMASGGYSNLDYGSDNTYENSGGGTPSKGSEGGLEIEMEALAVEDQAAINNAVTGRHENLQPASSSMLETTGKRRDEAAGMETQVQPAFLEGVPGKGIPEIEVQEESSEPGIQTAQTANRGGLAGVSFATSGLRGSLSGGLGKMEPEHRRRGSQESIVSEISSVPGSDLSRAVSIDVPLESSLWGFAGMEPSGEGGSSTGTEVESLKGVGLILPVDQRSRVRRVMMTLQRRLAVVKTDMDDLLARLNQETAVKDFLTTKGDPDVYSSSILRNILHWEEFYQVRDLEGELDGMRRKSREVLQQAVSLERERVTSLQWELEECRVALQAAEESAQSQQDGKGQFEQRLQEAEAKCESVEKEMVDMRQLVQSLQRERDAVDAQARADKKVLAKEIRSLRVSQAELKQEAQQAIQAKAALEASLQVEKQKQERAMVSRGRFLHEVNMLRQRLQECSVDVLAREEDKAANKGASGGVIDSFDLLSTSDNRIGLLLAEAQLLAQDDEEVRKAQSSTNGALLNGQFHSNGDVGRSLHSAVDSLSVDRESEAALRKMLTDVFIEQAQLRKAMNALTRNALTSVQQQTRNLGPAEELVQRKSLLDRIL